MTQNMKDNIFAFLVVVGIAFGGTGILYVDAAAQTPGGFNNLVVWLGTSSNSAEALIVGTGNNQARSGSVLGSIVIGSGMSGGQLFSVYDSSTSALSGKYAIGTFACGSPVQFTFNQAMQYGLWMVNTGCKAALTYLPHK